MFHNHRQEVGEPHINTHLGMPERNSNQETCIAMALIPELLTLLSDTCPTGTGEVWLRKGDNPEGCSQSTASYPQPKSQATHFCFSEQVAAGIGSGENCSICCRRKVQAGESLPGARIIIIR